MDGLYCVYVYVPRPFCASLFVSYLFVLRSLCLLGLGHCIARDIIVCIGGFQSQVGTQGVATFASVFGVLFGFTVYESVGWGAYQWLIHSA